MKIISYEKWFLIKPNKIQTKHFSEQSTVYIRLSQAEKTGRGNNQKDRNQKTLLQSLKGMRLFLNKVLTDVSSVEAVERTWCDLSIRKVMTRPSCNRVRYYFLDAMGNRSAIIHHEEDNQQVHSFLPHSWNNSHGSTSWGCSLTFFHLHLWAHKISHLPEPTKAQTFACAVCKCRCESSAVTQEAEEENYSFLVACKSSIWLTKS